MSKNKQARLDPEVRRKKILAAAIRLCHTKSYMSITRTEIAVAAGVSDGLVTIYFGTMTQLRRVIMREAVKTSSIEIIAQGLVDYNPYAKKASEADRRRAAELIAGIA